MHRAVLHHCGPENDAAIDGAVGSEVADAAGIGSARLGFELCDDLAGANLRGAGDGAGGKTGEEGVERVLGRIEPADHVADDVHHVAVALDGETGGNLHAVGGGDPADVIAAEVEQHQMLGVLLGIGEQAFAVRLVLFARGAARAGAGDRADSHLAIAHADEDFRARSDHRETGEIEEVEEWRRVYAPERAIEREGRQGEGASEALRQHDLEDVTGGDVVLRLEHHLAIGAFAHNRRER